MRRLILATIAVAWLFVGAPVAQADTVTIEVVISEEAARYYRENPVPDARPRHTDFMQEQSEVMVAGVSNTSHSVPGSIVMVVGAGIYLVTRTKKRLRTATAVG